MFLPDDAIHSDALFQGDIISETQHFGAISTSNIFFAKGSDESIAHWGVSQKPIFGPAIILSHSCEISLENDMKLTSIILAPIRDIAKASHPDKIQDIIDSNLPESKPFSYLKYFYLEPTGFIGTIGEKRGCVVDFSKCYSVNKNSYDSILKNKVLEMREDIREQFSIKNALFYFREREAT